MNENLTINTKCIHKEKVEVVETLTLISSSQMGNPMTPIFCTPPCICSQVGICSLKIFNEHLKNDIKKLHEKRKLN